MVDIYEIQVPDIRPLYNIEILDKERAPIAQLTFKVGVDSGTAERKKTDTKGVIQVARPVSKILISFP